ncbi:salivary glue protein Sgs-3-like [Culicoides brevitarsis]|uniref:salivary glue protein Sgs-3-like n=1 Tax=Culicoides brevitarsis TaxID=469753 RepID=UPI00307BBCD7
MKKILIFGFLVIFLISISNADVTHNVWGAKYTTTTSATTETTPETSTFPMNDDFDSNNLSDVNILGAPAEGDEEETASEVVEEVTTEEVEETEATTEAETTTPETTTRTTTTTSTTKKPPTTTKKLQNNFVEVKLMDILDKKPVEDETVTEKPSDNSDCDSCDCSDGCDKGQNCKPCCGGINFHSVNNGGNFTFNADFRKGCKNAGCN